MKIEILDLLGWRNASSYYTDGPVKIEVDGVQVFPVVERAQGVLAPRFTRDEAIEACALVFRTYQGPWRAAYADGMRAALEALAAAGAFLDEPSERTCDACEGYGYTNPGWNRDCALCGGEGRVAQTMADKLDAAGIR